MSKKARFDQASILLLFGQTVEGHRRQASIDLEIEVNHKHGYVRMVGRECDWQANKTYHIGQFEINRDEFISDLEWLLERVKRLG